MSFSKSDLNKIFRKPTGVDEFQEISPFYDHCLKARAESQFKEHIFEDGLGMMHHLSNCTTTTNQVAFPELTPAKAIENLRSVLDKMNDLREQRKQEIFKEIQDKFPIISDDLADALALAVINGTVEELKAKPFLTIPIESMSGYYSKMFLTKDIERRKLTTIKVTDI